MQQTRRNVSERKCDCEKFARKRIVSQITITNTITSTKIFFPFAFRNLVRNTRQSQLQSVDNSANDQVFLGKQGKDFEFAHLPQTVDVVECSGKDGDLDNIIEWLDSLN